MPFSVSLLPRDLFTSSADFIFLGALVNMGYNVQPEMSCYWCKDGDLGVNCIQKHFTRARFMFIWSNLHYSLHPSYVRAGERFTWGKDAQMEMEKKEDPIARVRMLCEMVNRKFREVRNPCRNLCVDETMTAYKGRSSILQCQPRKPDKLGYEHFTLCANDSGYILNDEAHLGAAVQLVFGDDEPKPK